MDKVLLIIQPSIATSQINIIVMRNLILLFLVVILGSAANAQTPETIVGWDGASFTYQSTDNATYWRYPFANTGLVGNISVSTMRTFGGVSPSTASDAYGNGNQILFNENPGNGWINGTGQKGWVFKFKTLGYEGLKFSGKMAGSTSLFNFKGPRDFKLQYSTDSIAWTDVSGGTLAAGNAGAASYTLTTLSNVVLPSACDNQPTLFLRMLMTSETSPDGFTATASGMSFVDDFVVVGQSTPVAPSNIILSSQTSLVAIGAQASAGTTIGTLSSVDFNLGNTFTYTLVNGVGDTHNGSFLISGNTLMVNASLPRGIYSVRIRSTDNASLFLEKVFLIYIMETQPGIFSNPITGTAPANSNPYTTGQTVAANLTVSGIKRGSSLTVSTSNDRYACTNWGATLDANKYFEFVLTPGAGFGIKFEYLEATLQRTSTSAKNFTLRSSVDNYTTDIYSITNIPTTATAHKFPLLAAMFQNVTSPITFRLYGWDATSTTATASVNDFSFKGVIGTGTCTPTLNSSTQSACATYTWAYNNQTYTSSGVYTVIGVNAGGCTHTEILNLTITSPTTSTSTVSACDTYTWSVNNQTYTTSGTYSVSSGCTIDQLVLTINPSSTVIQNETACTSYTWGMNNVTYTASGNYTNLVGCTTHNLNLQIQACADITFLIEGYYLGSGLMQPVLQNQGVAGALATECDSVTIEFREATPPYAQVYKNRKKFATNGSFHAVLPEAANGQSFYIVVQHRNGLETWSSAPVLIGSNTVYDFSTAATQAYGDNQIEVAPGVFALYSGDIQKDGGIDVSDYLVMEPDIINGNTGYLDTDLNGDGGVDVFDFLVAQMNITNGVSYITP